MEPRTSALGSQVSPLQRETSETSLEHGRELSTGWTEWQGERGSDMQAGSSFCFPFTAPPVSQRTPGTGFTASTEMSRRVKTGMYNLQLCVSGTEEEAFI